MESLFNKYLLFVNSLKVMEEEADVDQAFRNVLERTPELCQDCWRYLPPAPCSKKEAVSMPVTKKMEIKFESNQRGFLSLKCSRNGGFS